MEQRAREEWIAFQISVQVEPADVSFGIVWIEPEIGCASSNDFGSTVAEQALRSRIPACYSTALIDRDESDMGAFQNCFVEFGELRERPFGFYLFGLVLPETDDPLRASGFVDLHGAGTSHPLTLDRFENDLIGSVILNRLTRGGRGRAPGGRGGGA